MRAANGKIRAVLFDLGGTLYDYRSLEPANREALIELARWAGSPAEPEEIVEAHREAMREVFRDYLPRPFYLHRDFFGDALLGMAQRLGISLGDGLVERYRALQRRGHDRDFALREGVLETLRALRERSLHLGIVSNIDEDQLEHLSGLAELAALFDDMLSSEVARSCKPHSAIFEEALRRAGCSAREALFIGDTLRQDIEGANRVGLRSVLLWHRDDRSPPPDGPRPQHVIRRIPELLELLGA
jgi:HAD superfamily hydrolase (TIGR01509 family)